MEKNEKIEQIRNRRLRILASLALGCCLVGAVFVSLQGSDFFSDKPPSSSKPSLAKASDVAGPSESQLVAQVKELDQKVRDIKKTGVFLEVDPKGLEASRQLQDATRHLLARRYGSKEPYRVRVDLKFQESNPTYEANGEDGSFTIELAPSRLVPHSIFSFLEIARHWDDHKGAFHRRANHVLQVTVKGNQVPHLAFQEYSDLFPHVKGTVGYAGRPSGPAWYVSIMNNSNNHGPGSQQAANPHEADSCFGKVVEGFDDVVLKRITKMPGTGFLDKDKHVFIDKMTILVLDDTGKYVPWKQSGTLVQ